MLQELHLVGNLPVAGTSGRRSASTSPLKSCHLRVNAETSTHTKEAASPLQLKNGLSAVQHDQPHASILHIFISILFC